MLEWVVAPFSKGTSQPSDQTQVPTLQVDSSPPEATREAPQARLLEWIAMLFSKGTSQSRDGTLLSYVSYIGSRVF